MAMILFLVCACLAAWIFNYLVPNGSPRRTRIRSIRIPIWPGWVFHLHHWIYCSAMMYAAFQLGWTHDVIIGGLTGCIAQGVCYNHHPTSFHLIYRTDRGSFGAQQPLITDSRYG